jgi:hypothetical protein
VIRSFHEASVRLQQLHIILDSPAEFPVSKTELDTGVITEPYQQIAQCIRAALCISHDLRRWVWISICFGNLGPLTVKINPQTIRFLGTDERSILHIILRAQIGRNKRKRKNKTPHGISISNLDAKETIAKEMTAETLLLLPGTNTTWHNQISNKEILMMYCPLFEYTTIELDQDYPVQYYLDYRKRDLAILTVLHHIDSIGAGVQKD